RLFEELLRGRLPAGDSGGAGPARPGGGEGTLGGGDAPAAAPAIPADAPDTCAGLPPPAPSPLSGGTTFARYVVESELARGGMGVVYRARDPQLQRPVALKVMLGGDDTPAEERRRFQREALLAARLQHPNIVPVYDVGEFAGKLYYTMELIEGESLAGVLARMLVLPPRAALRIARDAARALQYAHDQNLVHRDIKPGNLLITAAGPLDLGEKPGRDTTISLRGRAAASFRVLLTDVGVARDASAATRLTRTGDVLGTPLYMSPEQAEGDSARIGPASDVYSLGAVLYEMLCGKPPFTETSAVQLLAAVILRDPPRLRARAPAIHSDLETIVARAMEKEPRRRYASAKEFADDIERYLSGEMIRARPASFAYRAWRGIVRRRELVGTLAAALLLVGGVVAWFTVLPRWEARRAAGRDAEARRARAADARARAAIAEWALAAGRIDETERLAERLVAEFGAAAERGEEVAQPEAHDLLARVHAARGDARRALLERFRAYRAAAGAQGNDAYLLKTARELVGQLAYDEALPLLARLVRETSRPELRAEAEYWTGRAAEGTLDFGGALGHFTQALAGPAGGADAGAGAAAGANGPGGRAAGAAAGAGDDWRADCAEHRAFCAALGRRMPVPVPGTGHVNVDLDVDGRMDIAGLQGDQVFFGRIVEGRWAEGGRLTLAAASGTGLTSVCAVDLPDARHPTLLVTTGGKKEGEGRLWLVRWDGRALVELAADAINNGVRSAAVGDLDGDGRPELVLGTPASERSVRVYDWDEGARKLALRARVGAGADVQAVDVVDADGDGACEVLVCAGAWGAYGVALWRWERARGEFERGAWVPLGVPQSLVRLAPTAGAAESWALGTSWDLVMTHPLRRLRGRAAFEREYAPCGVYRIDAGRDRTLAVAPLAAARWSAGDSGSWTALTLRGGAGEFVWCAAAPPREDRAEAGAAGAEGAAGARAGRIEVFRAGAWARPFVTLLRPASWSQSPFAAGMLKLDVDGDGAAELVAGTGSGMVALLPVAAAGGQEPAPVLRGTPDALTGGGADAVGAGPAARDPLLDAAAVAERVGLAEEALAGYAAARQRAAGLSDVEAAVHGQLRCLLSLGRAAELAAVAESAAAAAPLLETPILRAGVRLLDQGRHWPEAARLARRLLQALDLDIDDRATLDRQATQFAELAEFRHRLRLVGVAAAPAAAAGGADSGPGAAAVDWLATSPLVAQRQPGGSWKVFAAPLNSDQVLAPVTTPAGAWQVVGALRDLRLDWGGNLRIGAGCFDPLVERDPLRAVCLGASGDTDWPLFSLGLASSAPGGAVPARTLRLSGDAWNAPLSFELSLVAHQHTLVGAVAGGWTGEGGGGGGGAGPLGCALAAVQPEGAVLLVGLTFSGSARPGYWSTLSLDALEIASAAGPVAPAPWRPIDAAGHLLLANGRRIAGRDAEALPLYDTAITLADLERTAAEAARAAGVPAAWDRASAFDFLRWPHVDGRVWRGLARAAGGDAAGAVADLKAAWTLAAGRVRDLVARHAAPLAERPAELAALRAFWSELAGHPAAERRAAWARETVGACGASAAEILIAGLKVVEGTRLRIRSVTPGGAAAQVGLQAGDVITAVDGAKLSSIDELKAALAGAAQAGRKQVTVDLRRGERSGKGALPATLGLGIEIERIPYSEIELDR
ncbi:MAG: protein kinase, partial [Planctomycetes bacterium]|nr:protein kinase [Planctomycetota bacterium]